MEAIDLTKDEEHVVKTDVPIISENENKEEPPTNPVGEKKMETWNESSEKDTHSNKEHTS